MTSTYENLACNIQVPNLEHNLLKTGFLPITAMLLATKVGEMEWFPNEFQVDLLQHKTLCWHLEVGGIFPNLLRIWGNLILGFDLRYI